MYMQVLPLCSEEKVFVKAATMYAMRISNIAKHMIAYTEHRIRISPLSDLYQNTLNELALPR